jgi:YD repeat-containing protein
MGSRSWPPVCCLLPGWQDGWPGRGLAVTDPFTGTVGYAYDALGNRTRLIYPDNKLVQYSYDPVGRMTQVIDWDSQVITYTYNSASAILGEYRPGGLDTSYTYDELGRVTAIDHSHNGNLLSSFQYVYDPAGNRVQAEDIFRQEAETEIPATPAGLQPVGQGYASVALSWLDNSDNEGGYYVYRSTDNQNWVRVASLGADQIGYLDQGLTRHTQYWYRVTAWNNLGESDAVTTTAQTGLLEEEPEGVIEASGVMSSTSLITYTYDALNRLTVADEHQIFSFLVFSFFSFPCSAWERCSGTQKLDSTLRGRVIFRKEVHDGRTKEIYSRFQG